MRLVGHIAAKDLRRFAWPVAGWIAFTVATTLWLGLGWFDGAAEGAFERWRALRNVSAILVGLQVTIGFILAGALLLEDPVAGDASAWRTRPIARGRMLAGKALAAGLAFVVAPAVALGLAGALAGLALPEAAGVARDFMYWQVWATVPALAVASLARDRRQFLLYAAVLGAAYALCTAYFFTARWVEPLDLELRRSRGFITQYALVPGAALVLLHQFFSRAERRTWLGIAIGLPALLWVRLAWPWDILPAVADRWPTAENRPPASEIAMEAAAIATDENGGLVLQVKTGRAANAGAVVAALAAAADDREEYFLPARDWGEQAAKRALGVAGGPATETNWVLARRSWPPVVAARTSVPRRGMLLGAEMQVAVVGELALQRGATIDAGSTRTRVLGLTPTPIGIAAVLEEHVPVARSEGAPARPRGSLARVATRRECYLLVSRATGSARAVEPRAIGETSLNGFGVRFLELDLGDVPADAVLAKVRFEPQRLFAAPFTALRAPAN